MSDDQPTPDPSAPAEAPIVEALSFGSVVDAYERGRPGYPAEAVTWLLDGEALTVLEVGAGTGKLTAELVQQGHAVYATEPDERMHAVLVERVPGCSAKVASAEEIPANDRSVDVVVAGQAFHWFDHERALPEMARVLKPGGHVALAWNVLDRRIPWVRRLVELIGEHSITSDSHSVLGQSELFEEVETEVFTHWQDVDRESLVDIVASRSYVAILPDDERAARLDAVRALYDEYGRGHDGMQLPYRTECFRAKVIDPDEPATNGEDDASQEGPVVSDGTDTDMLLIDFR